MKQSETASNLVFTWMAGVTEISTFTLVHLYTNIHQSAQYFISLGDHISPLDASIIDPCASFVSPESSRSSFPIHCPP